MRLFGKKRQDEEDDGESSQRVIKSKLRDLRPENRKRRKEPVKPWGKKERFFVLSLLLMTIIVSILFSISSGNFEVPKLPSFNLDSVFKGKTVIVGDKKAVGKALRVKEAEAIASEFKNRTAGLKGTYVFEVLDLSDGFEFGANENNSLQGVSLIKLPGMVAMYREVEAGRLDLNSEYILKDSDRVPGSGSFYDLPAGTKLTYQKIVEEMGKSSDRTAYKIARDYLGEAKINKVVSDAEMKQTSIVTGETTPVDIASFFQKLWAGKLVSQESRDKMLAYLTDTTYEDWLPAGVPDNVRVSHKYGQDNGIVADAGIVFTPKPYVVVIMSEGVWGDEAGRVFPEISKMIYSKYAQNQNIR